MEKLDTDEKKMMFDLMKERELGGSMDWMYRGDKNDTEDYLLGKSVDKMITGESSTNEESAGGMGSIISERIKANVALDMQAKMREDPLFAIRRKEEEAKKRLLENPVKMKQLQRLVEQQHKSKAKALAKKEKKHKKKKKESKGSDSDSNSSDSEGDLVNQYLSILTQKQKSGDGSGRNKRHPHGDRQNVKHSGHFDGQHGRDRRKDQMSQRVGRHDRQDYRHFAEGRDRARQGADRRRHSSSPGRQRTMRKDSSEHSGSEERQLQRRRRDDSTDEEVSKRVHGLIKSVRHNTASEPPPPFTNKDRSRKTRRSRSSSRSPPPQARQKESHRSRSPSSSSKSNCYQSPLHQRSRSPIRRRRSRTPPPKRRSKSPPKQKLTAEEREKKLQEMMDNAKWREEQRTKNVQRYRQEEEQEASRAKSQQGGTNFLSSMMSEHASSSSVEDRLKRNKYNIQRTRAALDKNFTQQ